MRNETDTFLDHLETLLQSGKMPLMSLSGKDDRHRVTYVISDGSGSKLHVLTNGKPRSISVFCRDPGTNAAVSLRLTAKQKRRLAEAFNAWMVKRATILVDSLLAAHGEPSPITDELHEWTNDQ